jgi:hypothetical protein
MHRCNGHDLPLGEPTPSRLSDSSLAFWYLVSAVTSFINTVRTLGAHRYASDGTPLDREGRFGGGGCPRHARETWSRFERSPGQGTGLRTRVSAPNHLMETVKLGQREFTRRRGGAAVSAYFRQGLERHQRITYVGYYKAGPSPKSWPELAERESA